MEEKIKQLEQQIERETQKFNEYLEKGKGTQNEYTPIIIKEIKNNIKNEIEKFVKTDIENTNNLGIKKLSEMKKEMNVLIESIDNLANALLENINIWKVSQEFINSVDFEKDDIYSIKSDSEKLITKNIENCC